jgi:SpoVK/Ycf46/Vps4 family AAA+-type ATPase
MLATSQSESALDVVAEFKERRLRQKGILYVPKPDVEIAGIENIKISIDKAAAMLLPEAKEAKLPFPEGMVLIGPPGTGKSLAAKSAAKWMNVPLVCADWGNLIAPTPGQTEDNIRSLIELTESISPCILFFDDFDKAFASADLSRENATEKRVAGILLTWLQERTADVYVIVTCNRVLQIPPELLRRFSDIIFVDLPHEGSRFEIFKSHLNKHGADYTHWTDIQWKNIIKRYNECTPDEIGKAVNWAVTDRFRTDRTKNVIVEDLLKAREQFTPSNIANSMTGGGNVISDIRLFCMPYKKAASEDNSEFKITPVPEFVALGR